MTDDLYNPANDKPARPFATPSVTDTKAEEIPPVHYRYRIGVVLTPQLETQINSVRGGVGLSTAEAGAFKLLSDFHLKDGASDAEDSADDNQDANPSDMLVVTLRAWAKKHLPFTLEITKMTALVIGEQRYAAGFGLDNVKVLTKAQATLQAAFAEHVTPISEEPFLPHIPVADHVPAAKYPRLLFGLNGGLEPTSFTFKAVELLRADENDMRWEVVEKVSI